MRLKKERIADYVEVHRKENVWRSVVDCLVRSGTTRMIILLHGQDVILYEEAHDLQHAYQVQNADPPTQRWEAMIAELMEQAPHFDEIKGAPGVPRSADRLPPGRRQAAVIRDPRYGLPSSRLTTGDQKWLSLPSISLLRTAGLAWS